MSIKLIKKIMLQEVKIINKRLLNVSDNTIRFVLYGKLSELSFLLSINKSSFLTRNELKHLISYRLDNIKHILLDTNDFIYMSILNGIRCELEFYLTIIDYLF